MKRQNGHQIMKPFSVIVRLVYTRVLATQDQATSRMDTKERPLKDKTPKQPGSCLGKLEHLERRLAPKPSRPLSRTKATKPAPDFPRTLKRNRQTPALFKPQPSSDHLTPEECAQLEYETGYEQKQIFALWCRFKALCELSEDSTTTTTKGIDKRAFRHGNPLLSVEDHAFVDRMFELLSDGAQGRIQWHDFLKAMSVLENGHLGQRMTFLFQIYDTRGTGEIPRGVLEDFFLASLFMTPTSEILEIASEFVHRIFRDLGVPEAHTLRLEDVLKYVIEPTNIDVLFGRHMIIHGGKAGTRRRSSGHQEKGRRCKTLIPSSEREPGKTDGLRM